MVLLESVPRMRRLGAFARAGLVLGVVLGLDQLTKHTVAAGIGAGEQQKFLPGVNLVHVRNKGVAFGAFGGGGVVVLVITLAALLLVIGYLALRPDMPWLWVPTGLLVGGALGN